MINARFRFSAAGATREISSLGIKLPEQAVQIFICTFLPYTIRISIIDITVQSLLNSAPVCELGSTVAGNCLDHLRRKGGVIILSVFVFREIWAFIYGMVYTVITSIALDGTTLFLKKANLSIYRDESEQKTEADTAGDPQS